MSRYRRSRRRMGYVQSVTTPAGVRYKKGQYVRQIPTGGVGQILNFNDDLSVIMQVQVSQGGYFVGVTTVENLEELTADELAEFGLTEDEDNAETGNAD